MGDGGRMHNPAAFAVDRPRVVGVAALLAVVFGALSYAGLPRQENPTIADRFASVLTYVPGAEPEKMELLVSKVFEDNLAELEDLDTLFCRSTTGTSFVLVSWKEGAPYRRRMQEFRDKVAEIRPLLPATATEPDIDTRPLRTNTMVLGLVAEGTIPLLLRYHAEELERALRLLPDVARVELLGLPEEEIAVDVDMRRLAARSMSVPHIASALAGRNIYQPGGELEVGTARYPIQTLGAFDTEQEVANTDLGAGPDGMPIRLRDVATVERRLAEDEVIVRRNGQRAVSIAIEMLPRRNAIAFGERIRRFIDQHRLPAGLRLEVIADEPYYVQQRLDMLTDNLLVGMALVIVLTIAGMGWRSGVMVSLTIPLSLAAAMGLLSIAGVALHQISISAMVIAVGLLVDDAIVVTDNIQRHRDLGASPRDAAVDGLGEIHHAVLAGAGTTIAAFVPLAVMAGDVGEFVRSIPIAVSLILIAAVVVAHYVTPLLSVLFHSAFPPTGPRRTQGVAGGPYRPLLRFVIRHPRAVVSAFVVVLAISLLALDRFLLPPEFFPDTGRHQLLVEASMPPGSTLAETDAVMRRLEEAFTADAGVSDGGAFGGGGAPKFFINQFTEGRSRRTAMAIVNLDRDLPTNGLPRLAEDMELQLQSRIVGPFVRVHKLRQGYGQNDDIEIYVEGDDLATLRALATRIRDIARDTPGTRNVRESFGYDPLTFEVKVRRAHANLLGITHEEIATTLRTALDGLSATTLREGDDEIDIVVRLPAERRRSLADLRDLPIYGAHGSVAPLSQVADLVPAFTTREILRWQRKREVMITASVVGRPIVSVTDDILREVERRIDLPEGYGLSYQGNKDEVEESFLSLARAALAAILLIYIILVVRFHSLSQPALIVLAIPMALIGGIWGLIAPSYPLGFMAFLAMIALTGVVVNASIILLDYINTLRRRGRPLEAAVEEGAATRLRPVVLTTVTTVGGLLPLSISGGAFFGPFGFVMVFGLVGSMGLTLLVQPAAYLALERWRRRSVAADRDDSPAGTAAALP